MNINLQNFCLAVLLALIFYSIWLIRTQRLNAHIVYSWIIVEGFALIAIIFWKWLPIFGYTSVMDDRSLLMLLATFFFALIAYLMLDCLSRISKLDKKCLRLIQELAILNQKNASNEKE